MNKHLILLVEDEPLVALTLEDAFIDAGYEVVTVAAGSDAIAELDGDASRFQGIVTDVRLSDHILGWQVGERARELDPAIPIIFVSGDSAGDWADKGVSDSIMLGKPFALTQLVAKMSEMIAAVSRPPT
jgi:CheY-like chemotaxis protein